MPAEELPLFRLHFLCFIVFLVVHSHEVEQPVDDQQRNFTVGHARLPACWARS